MGEEKGACKFSFRSTQNWQFSVSKCTIMIAILISMILLFLSSLEYKILHIITLCTYNIRHWAQTLRIPITIFLCSCLDILYVMYLSLLSSRKAQLHQKAYFIWKTSRVFCWNFWRLFICKEVKHLVLQLYPLFLLFGVVWRARVVVIFKTSTRSSKMKFVCKSYNRFWSYPYVRKFQCKIRSNLWGAKAKVSFGCQGTPGNLSACLEVLGAALCNNLISMDLLKGVFFSNKF
jgi:hypothetical protein